MVLSYPHFLYADSLYRNGVIGMNPIEDEHRIFLDLEPNTGTVIRGMKRAQFNVFLRPITGIPATQNLRTTLTPIVWVEEGMNLPEEFVDEVTSKLLSPLNLVGVLIPVLVAITAAVFVLGIIILVRAKRSSPTNPASTMPTTIAKNN
ncbi:CD36 family domain-containing protein [Phthorimaea operculella]|nr:CD36 family domain-containing protein [Phthorimaea operculella]